MNNFDPSAYSKPELLKMLRTSDWDCPNEKAYRKSIKSPVTAIRAMCVICMGGSVNDVSTCEKSNCPLWPFRFGKNPLDARAGVYKDTSHMRREKDAE